MTTKKARSRRLVRSDEIDGYRFSASDGKLCTFVHRPSRFNGRGNGRNEWTADRWDGVSYFRRIRARTRLALHDAIVRAGWPSPWLEVGTKPTAKFSADLRAAGWKVTVAPLFRDGQITGWAETNFNGIRINAEICPDRLLIRCRYTPTTGKELGFGCGVTMVEWDALGAEFHTARIAQLFRDGMLIHGGVDRL